MSVGPAHPHHHAVQFYGNEKVLFTSVAGFLSQGLIDGQPAVLIATSEHSQQILDHLASRFINTTTALRSGDLTVLDAHETLAQFMVDGMPDADAFQASVGTLIARLAGRSSQPTFVRAYGEMVDVLWKQGQEPAALKLEGLWNKLASRYGFALLCGYAMGNFSKDTELFEEVCRHHSHVMPSRAPLVSPPGDRRLQ
jgi:hypothetical protein